MAQEEPNFSRTGRKKRRNRSNRILNLLIGIVVLLIIVVATSIIFQGGEDQADEDAVADQTVTEDNANTEEQAPTGNANTEEQAPTGNATDEHDEDGNDPQLENDPEMGNEENRQPEEDNTHSPGTVTIVPSEDEVIAETVINTSWQPIGTTQTGEHISTYDGKSVDWEEKKKALAYATGLPYNSMIFWKIKNGGGPQQSVGIVSSRDNKEKYRVYLEWVDDKGWKPVKMDVLTTLDFDY